ncbi:MAG: cupin domain-containing protein [Alphaproteobacteria bacterium]|nr:cupin domain-containing protein [Alphaproteobacteria bacterium]
MPKLDLDAIPEIQRTGYPEPYRGAVAGRNYRRLADAAGLTDFGVNICRLEPGAWSSQRHWHSKEDEFVMMISGEAVLITDAGETVMRPGDCAAFPAGLADAHHLVNRSDADAVFLVVGSDKADDACTYPDIDMHLPRGDGGFTRKDGTPW